MNREKYKKWAQAAAIRAIRTFFQSFAACLTVGIAISEIDFLKNFEVALAAAIYSICTSLGGLPEIEIEEEDEKDD